MLKYLTYKALRFAVWITHQIHLTILAHLREAALGQRRLNTTYLPSWLQTISVQSSRQKPFKRHPIKFIRPMVRCANP
jgi:hypothetical protein